MRRVRDDTGRRGHAGQSQRTEGGSTLLRVGSAVSIDEVLGRSRRLGSSDRSEPVTAERRRHRSGGRYAERVPTYSRLLLPSSQESRPRVGLEAACSGIPAIATPIAGVYEALGESALYADRDNPEAWVAHLRSLEEPSFYQARGGLRRARAAQLLPTQTSSSSSVSCTRHLGPRQNGKPTMIRDHSGFEFSEPNWSATRRAQCAVVPRTVRSRDRRQRINGRNSGALQAVGRPAGPQHRGRVTVSRCGSRTKRRCRRCQGRSTALRMPTTSSDRRGSRHG